MLIRSVGVYHGCKEGQMVGREKKLARTVAL